MSRKHTGYLFQRGQTWYVQYRVDGKTIVKSTNQTERDKAEDERARIMAPIQLSEQADSLRLLSGRIADLDAAADAARAPDAPAIADVWGIFLRSPDRNDSGPETLRQYRSHWDQFAGWIGPEVRTIDQVTEAHARRYAKSLTDRGLSGNRYNKHSRFLAALWHVLRLSPDVWSRIKQRRLETHSRRELTMDQVRTIIHAAKGEMRTLFAIGAYTGLRLGDCATLLWDEVDLVNRVIVRVPNKTQRRREPVRVPIHPDLMTELGKAGKGQVLPELAQLYRRDNAAVVKRVQAHLTSDAVGIRTTETLNGKAVTVVGFHSLRHTFVSICRAAGIPLSVVEAIVGHSSPAMTKHYSHTGDAAAAAAVATLPALKPGRALREALPAWATRLIKTLTPANCEKVKATLLR